MRHKKNPRPILILLIIIVVLVTVVSLIIKKTDRQSGSFNESGLPKATTPDKNEQTPTFDKQKYSLDNPESIWVIVNKTRALDPISFSPTDLTDVGNGQYMRNEATDAFAKLSKAASAEGMTLQPMSGYRSYQIQQGVYSREVAAYGQSTADRQSAKPGHSEHQTGLSIDIGGGGCGIENCFGNTAEGKWVSANAYKYGFIIRYPEGKEAVTGYLYEPWHIRYVGEILSTEMRRVNSSTLEEFFNL